MALGPGSAIAVPGSTACGISRHVSGMNSPATRTRPKNILQCCPRPAYPGDSGQGETVFHPAGTWLRKPAGPTCVRMSTVGFPGSLGAGSFRRKRCVRAIEYGTSIGRACHARVTLGVALIGLGNAPVLCEGHQRGKRDSSLYLQLGDRGCLQNGTGET